MAQPDENAFGPKTNPSLPTFPTRSAGCGPQLVRVTARRAGKAGGAPWGAAREGSRAEPWFGAPEPPPTGRGEGRAHPSAPQTGLERGSLERGRPGRKTTI